MDRESANKYVQYLSKCVNIKSICTAVISSWITDFLVQA